MAIVKSGSARYEGLGKEGKGHVSTGSGALDNQPYGFNTRFENERGTNPEELIAAAHASCFTMALSFALAKAGHSDGTLETTAKVTLEKDGDGFTVTRSDLSLTGSVPGVGKDEFTALADDAKANCPISKLLNAEITLETTFNGCSDLTATESHGLFVRTVDFERLHPRIARDEGDARGGLADAARLITQPGARPASPVCAGS
jgi:osmotically inducible protein OsmC